MGSVNAHNSCLNSVQMRERVGAFFQQYATVQLSLPEEYVNANIKVLYDPKSIIVEVGHTPQLFHLGVFRLIVYALELAKKLSQKEKRPAIVIFAVNDYVDAGRLPETRYLRYYFRGKLPKRPIKLGATKQDYNLPLFRLRPPPTSQIFTARDMIVQFLPANVSYTKKIFAIEDVNIVAVRRRVMEIFDLMVSATMSVNTFVAWTIRLLYDILFQVSDSFSFFIIVLPTSYYSQLFPEYIEMIVSQHAAINTIKNRTPGFNSVNEDALSSWVTCPECGRLCERPLVNPANYISFTCKRCGKAWIQPWHKLQIIPDVVARQGIASHLGIQYRVTGKERSYARVADEVIQQLFSISAPGRIHVEGQSAFLGIGEPREGCERPSLARVLFEKSTSEIYRTLASAKPSDNIILTSDYLTL